VEQGSRELQGAAVHHPLVVVLSGPTGVGKTRLALQLAKALPVEIVSADSMQVYRGMDIGTAKASCAEQRSVRHHLLDIRHVTERYSVYDFFQDAQAACMEIIGRGKVPILCGGTGFYLHAFLYGPPIGPTPNPDLRRSLETEIELLGAEPLFERLTVADPAYASTITSNDRQKIVRALEIMHLTGKRVSELPWGRRDPLDHFRYLCWFLHRPRSSLYPILDARCDRMLEEGLLEEVQRLDNEGLRENSSAAQAIGYRHCLEYLDGSGSQGDYEEFIQRFRRDSHRYAKRQFTWFRRESLFQWVDVSSADFDLLADGLVQEIQKHL